MTAPANFNSVEQVIRDAMENAGLLEDLQDPTPEQFARYTNRLNKVINFEQTQGLKLWLMEDLAVTLVAGTATYTLGPGGSIITTKPIRAIQGYYLDSSSNRRPIFPMSWDEWLRLSTTTTQGPITQFLVDKQLSNLVISFWLTPDATAATGTAHLFIEQQVTNFTGLTDSMTFPTEWAIGLGWLLAADICTGQPDSIVTRCERKAAEYRMMLEAWDVEDASTSFAPDSTRGNLGSRRFM